jgi:hypothetical protein
MHQALHAGNEIVGDFGTDKVDTGGKLRARKLLRAGHAGNKQEADKDGKSSHDDSLLQIKKAGNLTLPFGESEESLLLLVFFLVFLFVHLLVVFLHVAFLFHFLVVFLRAGVRRGKGGDAYGREHGGDYDRQQLLHFCLPSAGLLVLLGNDAAESR